MKQALMFFVAVGVAQSASFAQETPLSFTPTENETCLRYRAASAAELVHGYSESLAGAVNDTLRGLNRKPAPACLTLVPRLKAALAKLKVAKNELVFRGTTLTNDYAKAKIGDCVQDPAFLSTSTSRKVAEFFAGSGQLLMSITVQNGRNIENLSSRPNEREVLIFPASTLRVEKPLFLEGNQNEIILSEVEPNECRRIVAIRAQPALISVIGKSDVPNRCIGTKSCTIKLTKPSQLKWECSRGIRTISSSDFNWDRSSAVTVKIGCDQKTGSPFTIVISQ